MDREWITTSELLAYLKAHPDDEKECRLYLGHRLGSTHYCNGVHKNRPLCIPATGLLHLSEKAR